MKKILAILLTLILSLTVFACGETPDDNGEKKDGIVASKTEITLTVGNTENLSVSGEENFAGDGTFYWTSEDETVATVEAIVLTPESACVTAVGVGSTTITVISGNGKLAKISVTVTELVATLTAQTVSVAKGNTANFPIENADGYTYSTDDETVATVNETTGVITAVGVGETKVNAEKGNTKLSVTVTVTVPETALTAETVSVAKGNTVPFPIANAEGYTYSSENSTLVSVDATTGVIKGNNIGTAKVFAQKGSKKFTVTVTVTVPEASLTAQTLTLDIGKLVYFPIKNATGYTYSSDNEAIVTVNATTGMITTVSAGTTTVRAQKDSKVFTVSVTVNPPEATLTASTVSVMKTATVPFPIENGYGYTYSSFNTAVATVDASTGVITGVETGTATIKAQKGNKAFTVTVTVTEYKMILSTNALSVLVSEQGVKFPLADTTGVTFASLDTTIATISSDGTITPKKVGEVMLTASKNGTTVSVWLGVLASKNKSVTLSATADERFNFFGRTKFNTSTSAQEFYYTSSGFDVTFYGTELKANFKTYKQNGSQGNQPVVYTPWLSVFVDGESMTNASLNPNGNRVIKLDSDGEKTIVSGLTKGWHTVKVRKRTAFQRGGTAMDYFAVKSFTVTDSDGYIGYTPNKSDFKIEVYGDSISCGFGNLTDGGTMTSENTDGVMAYHSVFANTIGADITVNACSGWGIMWDTSGTTSNCWPEYYNKLHARSSETYTSTGVDMILINLGTNDDSAITSANKNQFVSKYVAWLTALRSAHPDAVILCTYGMMGVNSVTRDAINETVNQMNDNKIYSYFYTNRASSGHPVVSVHKDCAQELLDFCEQNNLLP